MYRVRMVVFEKYASNNLKYYHPKSVIFQNTNEMFWTICGLFVRAFAVYLKFVCNAMIESKPNEAYRENSMQ